MRMLLFTKIKVLVGLLIKMNLIKKIEDFFFNILKNREEYDNKKKDGKFRIITLGLITIKKY